MTDEFKEETEIKKIISNLNDDTMDFIASYIQDGYKDTLARLLVYIGNDRAEKVLKKLPAELAAEVATRKEKLSGKTATDGEIAADGAFVLKDYSEEKLENEIERLRKTGIKNESFKTLCEKLFEENPCLSLKIKNSIFLFSDILILNDRSVQKVLRETDQQELAKALKGESKEVQDKIFRNMSQRAAAMLKDDIEFIGPVREQDINEAQQKIINTVLRLEEEGEIIIARDGSDETFDD